MSTVSEGSLTKQAHGIVAMLIIPMLSPWYFGRLQLQAWHVQTERLHSALNYSCSKMAQKNVFAIQIRAEKVIIYLFLFDMVHPVAVFIMFIAEEWFQGPVRASDWNAPQGVIPPW